VNVCTRYPDNTIASRHLLLIGVLLLGAMLPSVTRAAIPVPSAPELAARAYLLMDVNSGKLLAEDNADERMEPASLTKLMTAYIAFEELKSGTIHLDDMVLISEKAWRMGGSKMFIEVNKRVSVEKLLKGMIIQSGNDASVALAEHIAGTEDAFATLMNSYAENLGMTNTHFVNATGMPDRDHYTTARDLAKLAVAIIKESPDHYAWYSIKKYTYNGITQYNRNKLLWRDKYVDGLKTGHTESAGYCLIASAKRDDMRLLSVVLGTRSENARAQESDKLLNYGFHFFETRPLYTANTPLTKTRIWEGNVENLDLGLAKDLYITIPRGRYDKLKATMNIDGTIIAPVDKGQALGTVDITLEGEQIDSQPLISLHDVTAGDFFQRMSDKVMLMFE
jgi:D-alanyl-D-alanine carboxypeptidase (penicillin-binding protein 5/6)